MQPFLGKTVCTGAAIEARLNARDFAAKSTGFYDTWAVMNREKSRALRDVIQWRQLPLGIELVVQLAGVHLVALGFFDVAEGIEHFASIVGTQAMRVGHQRLVPVVDDSAD